MPHGCRLGTPRSRRVPLVSVPPPLPGSSIWECCVQRTVRTPRGSSVRTRAGSLLLSKSVRSPFTLGRVRSPFTLGTQHVSGRGRCSERNRPEGRDSLRLQSVRYPVPRLS
eukprot:6547952-Prymnesium_polylepis.1